MIEAPDTHLATQLIAAGALTPAQLDTALDVYQALITLGEPRRLPDLLVALGFVSPDRLAQAAHRFDDALVARLTRCLRGVTRLAP